MTRGQLRAILWLRWRLTRNQWAKSQGLGALLAVAIGTASVLGGLASFGGGLAGGWMLGLHAPPWAVPLTTAGLSVAFVFTWSIGVLVELQRSEVIDVPRLLQYPVRLAPVFLVNYLASHASPSVVVFVPAILGISFGGAAAAGPGALLAAPPALAFVFCTTAWTYCFQGWIAAWMTNPRRRRFVVTGLTLTIVAAGQVPNLLFSVLHVQVRASWGVLLRSMAGPAGAIAATLVLAALASVALWRGYVATVRFYRGGGTTGRRATHATDATHRAVVSGRRLVERRFPGLSEQASAVATATLRAVLRAPEAALAFGVATIVTCLLGATAIFRVRTLIPERFVPLLLEAAIAFSIFMLVPFTCNLFGLDRDGFRSLVLAPVDRRSILVGKNAAVLALGLVPSVPLVLLATIGLHPHPLLVASALLQGATMLLVSATVGNAVSVYIPYRMAAGSLKASGLPPAAWLAVIGCQLVFPVLFAPTFVPSLAYLLWQRAGWPLSWLAETVLSLLVAALAAWAYAASLGPSARLLQRRETTILARITVEHE